MIRAAAENRKAHSTVLRVLCLCIALLAVMLSACSSHNRQAASADAFRTKMEVHGFYLYDISNQYADYDFVETVLVASDGTLQFEFYITEGAEDATASFNHNRSVFEGYKTEGATEDAVEGANYGSYQLLAGDQYYIVSQIDNTLLYTAGPSEYETQVRKILDELGY